MYCCIFVLTGLRYPVIEVVHCQGCQCSLVTYHRERFLEVRGDKRKIVFYPVLFILWPLVSLWQCLDVPLFSWLRQTLKSGTLLFLIYTEFIVFIPREMHTGCLGTNADFFPNQLCRPSLCNQHGVIGFQLWNNYKIIIIRSSFQTSFHLILKQCSLNLLIHFKYFMFFYK